MWQPIDTSSLIGNAVIVSIDDIFNVSFIVLLVLYIDICRCNMISSVMPCESIVQLTPCPYPLHVKFTRSCKVALRDRGIKEKPI